MVIIVLEYQAVAPVGHWALLNLTLPFAMFAFFAIPGTFVCLGLLFIESCRPMAKFFLAVCLVYPPLILAGFLIGEKIRQSAFHRLAARSQPLVRAIHAFERDHGSPPPTLDDLLPGYLPAIPKTGMMAYPDYEFLQGSAAAEYNDAWVLLINTPSGGINFDTFLYLPRQIYPERGFGGALQRMGDWAYVHE